MAQGARERVKTFKNTISCGQKNFTICHTDPQDLIFRSIKENATFYESALLHVLAKYLEPGDLVVDVGANIGNHTIFFAGVAAANVIAVEPNPAAFALLERNVHNNKLNSQVKIVCAALGRAEARARIVDPSQSHNLGTAKVEVTESGTVSVTTLAKIVGGAPVKLVKIDVEGDELEILEGSKDLIAKWRPVLAIEAASHEEFARLFAFLSPFGYFSVGSYNYTATHVFAPVADADVRGLLGQLSLNSGFSYIDSLLANNKIGQLGRSVNEIKADRAATEALTTTIKKDVLEKTKALGDGLERVDDKIDALGGQIDAAFANFAEKVKEQRLGEKAIAGADVAALTSSEIFRAFDRVNHSILDIGSLLARLDERLEEARAYNFTGTNIFAPVNGTDVRDFIAQLSRQSELNWVDQLPVYSIQSEPTSGHEVTTKSDGVQTELIEKIMQFGKGVQEIGNDVESLESKVQRAFGLLSSRIEHLSASQDASLRATLTKFFQERDGHSLENSNEVLRAIEEMAEDGGLMGSMRANIETLLDETATPTLLAAQQTLATVEDIRANLVEGLSEIPEQIAAVETGLRRELAETLQVSLSESADALKRLETQADRSEQVIYEVVSELTSGALKAQSDELLGTIGERVAQLEERLAAIESNVEGGAERTVAKLEHLAESVSLLLDRTTSQVEGLPAHLEARLSAVDEKLAAVDANLSSNRGDLIRFALAIETATSQIETNSQNELRALNERLTGGLLQLGEAVNNCAAFVEGASKSLDDQKAQLLSAFAKQAEKLESIEEGARIAFGSSDGVAALVDQIYACAKEQTIEHIVDALGAMFADVVFEIERRAPAHGLLSGAAMAQATPQPIQQSSIGETTRSVPEVAAPKHREIQSMRAEIEAMQLAIDERDLVINQLRARLRSGEARNVASAIEVGTKASAVHQSGLPKPATKQGLTTKLLKKFKLDSDWGDWHPHESAELTEPGVVVLRQSNGSPGTMGPTVAYEGGGLLRVMADVESLPESGCRVHLRLIGDDGKLVGPDVRLKAGETEAYFFAPFRTKWIRAGIVVFNPALGYSLKVRSVTIDEVEQESYYRYHRPLGVSAPIIASMASVPARESMLRDTVASLLLSCDVVRVFMNAYTETPDFLNHPRVQYRRSQDWDDKGDAGKFGWIDAKDEPGYRVIVDDDLIFPPDFAAVMTRKVASYDNRAIVALHGVILKQPIASYYDPQSRGVFYFQNALAEDRTVHVLGTNAMCYYSEAIRLRWVDFMYRNMADIWLARYAQENKLPMIAASRDYCWVRQNTQATKFETIYEASLQKKKSFFDSSLVQDALAKRIAPLTMQPSGRPKVALVVCVWTCKDLEGFLGSWESSRDPNIDWVVVFAICRDPDGEVTAYLKDQSLQFETHATKGSDDTPPLQQALALVKNIECDVTIVTVEQIRFNGRKALQNFVTKVRGTQRSAITVCAPQRGEGVKVYPPALLALPKTFAECPIVDARLEPALAVVDWFMRVQEGSRTLDAALSGELLNVASDPFEEGVLEEILDRRNKLGPLSLAVAAPAVTGNARPTKINDLFERVVVLNLDRRPDRWNKIKERLDRAGIKADRVRAVDGAWPEVRADYVDYAGQPLVQSPKATRLIKSSLMFYKDYDSQMARVAYEENMRSRKAIASPGAWAYLKSYIRILEGALKDRVESLLVFDDDVVFHKNFGSLFREAAQDLPEDWLILQLGTLQYHWEPSWVHWRSPRLYSTGGSAIGSHAVGMRFDAYPFLLDHAQRMQLPFDTGALSAATKAFADRCFVISPNLAIQELADSDIGTSEFQSSERIKRIAETYRWHISDYDYGIVTDDVAAEKALAATAQMNF